MTLRIISLFILSFFLGGSINAQMKKYQYKREIKGITEQWHSIVLPNAIHEKANNNLGDIRIYGITNTDTIEAPYVLNIKSSKTKITPVDFKLLNESHTANQYFYTFEIPNQVTLNEVFLNFELLNFDYNIKIEGSQNLQEWFTIKENYRILSIENTITNYKFTTVKFPDSSYLYYRITINTAEDPKLNSAEIYENNSEAATYNTFSPKSIDVTNNKETKETIVTLDLDAAYPISFVKINVKNSIDYLRPTTIAYVVDSINTEKGWKYNYRNLTTSVLSSLNNNEFTFISTKAKKIKITINNQNNEPLDIDGAIVKGFVHELKVRFSKPANYFLVYGNKLATEPIYDINMMANVVPATAKPVTLEKEIPSDAVPEPETKPLFENKIWLWAIMILIIAIIGWFTYKMMRKV